MPNEVELWKAVIAFLGTLAAAYGLYLGAKRTSTSSKEGALRASEVDEQQSALEAWKELLDPYRQEVSRLSAERIKDREEQMREINALKIAREADRIELGRLGLEVEALKIEVRHWKSLAKAIARWAVTLRDQVISLGGSVPVIPDEVMLAQLLDPDEPHGREPSA